MKNLLTKNLGLKLLSLLVAILLWAIFVREPQRMTSVWVPVLFEGMPEGFEISAGLIDRVQLEVFGPASQLTPQKMSEAVVVLELGHVDQPGERTYTIRPSDVHLPAGVRCSRAMPSQIRLRFERRASRLIPVRVRYASPPPEGYVITRQEVIPDKLPVVGPATNLELITFVDTDPIDLSQVVGTAEFQVNAFVPDAHLRFEREPRVTVRIQVDKRP